MSEEQKEYAIEYIMQLQEENYKLQQENKQLKEELENDIDRYEDTISYQLGFDKGKEYIQQALLDIKELINKQLLSNTNITKYTDEMCLKDLKDIVNKALGDKE